MGDLMKTIQGGAIGTVGILANNGVANTVSNLANVTDPLYRQLVKVVSALSLPTLVGMVAPQFRAMTRDAMVCALAHEGAKIAEARVLPMLGANVSGALTSGDGSGYYGPPVPGPRDDKVKGFGYLPGARDYVGYLPGKLNYVGQGNRMLTPQMVNHF